MDDAVREAALARLVEEEGFASVDDLLEAVGMNAAVPAICTDPACGYSDLLEPDYEDACPECGAVMASALRLAEVI